MGDKRRPQTRPDAKALGLADYLAWLGNQLTATAVSAYATLGVGFLEARILYALGRSPDLLGASLVQHLGVDRAAVSRALQQLKSAGMIVADDQRRLSLTESGWEKHAEVVMVFDERVARLTAGLPEPELEELLGLLQRLHRNVSELFMLNARLAASSSRGHAAIHGGDQDI
jgi:DNA-binding MarR family transcriptional regulator